MSFGVEMDDGSNSTFYQGPLVVLVDVLCFKSEAVHIPCTGKNGHSMLLLAQVQAAIIQSIYYALGRWVSTGRFVQWRPTVTS